MVEIKTERASYYISTHGKCEYIDIEPGTDTFTFLSPESLNPNVFNWLRCNCITHLVSPEENFTRDTLFFKSFIFRMFPEGSFSCHLALFILCCLFKNCPYIFFCSANLLSKIVQFFHNFHFLSLFFLCLCYKSNMQNFP